VVAFELLTGRRPFAADTPVSEALANLNAPVPSAEKLDPALPDGVDRILSRALAKDPSDRPDSCAAFVADLRTAFQCEPSPTLVDTGMPTRRMPAVTPRRRLWLRLGIVSVAGARGALLALAPRRRAGSHRVELAATQRARWASSACGAPTLRASLCRSSLSSCSRHSSASPARRHRAQS
jgi:hypothetical protein